MTITTKNTGAYAAIVGVQHKKNGVCAAVAGCFAKVDGIYKNTLVNPYLGNFATRTGTPMQANVGTNFMSTSVHFNRAGKTVTGWQIAYPGFFCPQAYGPETQLASPLAYKPAVEYPPGVFTDVTWGGSLTGIAPPGSDTGLSDPIYVPVPDGAMFKLHPYVVGGDANSAISMGKADTARGERFRYGDNTLVDQTKSTSAWTSGTSNPTAVLPPCVIVGMITVPSVLIIGDSRNYGQLDTRADGSSDIGDTARSTGPLFGYSMMAVPNTRAMGFPAHFARRSVYKNFFSHVFCNFLINDFAAGSQTTAQGLSNMGIVAAQFPGKPFNVLTVDAYATSTDAWLTVENQTPFANDSARVAYNNTIRNVGTRPSWATFVHETADTGESARDSGKWKVGPVGAPVARYYVQDGIHRTTAGELFITSAGAINTSVIKM